MSQRFIALISLVATAGCATVPTHSVQPLAQVALFTGDGRALGTVDLIASSDGYQLAGTVTGLTPGLHGIHLHATGLCEGPEFTSAGSHLNPGIHQHGSMNPVGQHLGDLPNLVADQGGTARLALELRGTRADLDQDLFDSDKTSLVVHAGPDDYQTDPSGNSGKRIACGVLKRI